MLFGATKRGKVGEFQFEPYFLFIIAASFRNDRPAFWLKRKMAVQKMHLVQETGVLFNTIFEAALFNVLA